MRIFTLLSFLFLHTLSAEIETVTLSWDPINCNQACADLLYKQFQKIKGVDKISVSQAAGQATLQWQKGMPFDFPAINIAMRMVGASLDRLSLTVIGEIRPHDNGVSLISTGDKSKFELLSPISPKPREAVVEASAASHQLTPQMEEQLLAAYKERKVAVVNGPMLEPNRAPPNYLIIQSISFKEPEEEKGSRRSRSRR